MSVHQTWYHCLAGAVFALALGPLARAQDCTTLALIPAPTRCVRHPGAFVLPIDVAIAAPGTFDVMDLRTRLRLDTQPTRKAKATIVLRRIVDPALGDEGYRLQIDARGIRAQATSDAGLFYAGITLAQILAAQREAGAHVLPALDVIDTPRFRWRGLLVNVAEHFHDAATLHAVIDRMAQYKLNRLHLHLADNNAFRVDIPGYPKLIAAGDGHYFTPAELHELVAYAAEHHIEIVPEIDMPGHSGAVVHAYPELGDGGVTLNPVSAATDRFVDRVLATLATIFPGRTLHFAGDEVSNMHWADLPEVQAVLRQPSPPTLREIEAAFDRRVAAKILALGRVPASWDETANARLPARSIVQWWRKDHVEALHQALEEGHALILSPVDRVYLDYASGPGEPGAPWEGNDGGPISLDKILHWEPFDDPIVATHADQVLGIEACLWTEFIRTRAFFEFMLYPRLLAVAEVAWSAPAVRDSADFKARLMPHIERLKQAGINIRASADDASPYLVH